MSRKNRQADFIRLRMLHPVFSYLDFGWRIEANSMFVRYHFSDGIHDFHPEYVLPLPDEFVVKDEQLLDNLLFHIGLCEVISYWKSSCAPEIKIHPFALSKEGETWWKKLFYHGLGEFRYLNRIQCDEGAFVQFSYESERHPEPVETDIAGGVLVPVGGGKDSAVTLELLKAVQEDVTPFMMNGIPASFRTIERAGFSPEKSINIKRSLDSTLLKLNEEGYLNGHTPFSALLSFAALTMAVLYKKKHIALSNESSANESTIPGTKINHQYSKSLEYENDFRSYYKKYITPSIEYFSFLRPLTESAIARLFAGLPQHHATFRSCNCGSKSDTWCGRCSKCLFVWIILSPYLSSDALSTIFGKDLGADMSLLEDFKKLSGLLPEKPFECVGTVDEIRQSIAYAFRNGHQDNELYLYFMKNMPDGFVPSHNISHKLSPSHNVPAEFLVILKKRLL